MNCLQSTGTQTCILLLKWSTYDNMLDVAEKELFSARKSADRNADP